MSAPENKPCGRTTTPESAFLRTHIYIYAYTYIRVYVYMYMCVYIFT